MFVFECPRRQAYRHPVYANRQQGPVQSPTCPRKEIPMNGLNNPAIDKVNNVWGIHDRCKGSHPVPRCLALVVDERYLTDPMMEGEQFRVAASFGENPFPVGMTRGFLTPHPLPSKYVLGLHWVGTHGRV